VDAEKILLTRNRQDAALLILQIDQTLNTNGEHHVKIVVSCTELRKMHGLWRLSQEMQPWRIPKQRRNDGGGQPRGLHGGLPRLPKAVPIRGNQLFRGKEPGYQTRQLLLHLICQ
jgi:hypothetical protein